MSEMQDLPPEPGEVADPNLGLSDEEAGFPSHEPPENDVELGDSEVGTDGDDIDEED